MTQNNERKADKSLYNKNARDFIPVACHYDPSTLLTKNGNLVQTIEITGIDSEVISNKLGSLRQSIKDSLIKNICHPNIACWLHTVRHEVDLDDHTPYENKFSGDLHDQWVTKNSLRSRFVNSLYISIVSKPRGFYIGHLDNVVDASFLDSISNLHTTHLDKSLKQLTGIVDGIIHDLTDYLPHKLSIRFDGEVGYTEPLYLYKYLTSLRGAQMEVPLCDFSEILTPEDYAIRGDKIEIVENGAKKFASILSLKEYTNQDDDNLLENMLHLPVEFIATEILFAIDKKTAQEPHEYQDYILGISKDAEVRSAKDLDDLFDKGDDSKYIMQQLSIMIISDEVEKLQQATAKVSKSFSRIGFVNVIEDINLENIFWSQLPGNFKFMRRHTTNIINSSCAFVSIQNTPTGNRDSKWGKAVTVISTESNTPYFVNFHNAKNTGHTCIYGNANMGKSVLMNFLISEAMKFKPTIVYLSVDNSAELFIKSLGGQWCEDLKIPVLEHKTHVIVGMMVDIMSGQYSRICTDKEKALIQTLLAEINASGSYDAAISLVEKFKFPNSCEQMQECILSVIKYLNESYIQVDNGSIIGLNLGKIDNDENKDMRSAFVIAALRSLCMDKTSPKILVIDEMTHLFDHPYYAHYIGFVLDVAKAHNIVVIGSVDTDQYVNNISQVKLWQTLMANLDLQIVMHHQDVAYDLKTTFGLTEYEVKKLSNTKDKKRFIMKPAGALSTIGELSISSISHVMRILSCDEKDIEIYKEISSKTGVEPEKFLPELYKALK